MDKTLLRTIIVGLEVDQPINVVFRGALAGQTGNYLVVETKRGRGKGGSWLATLSPVAAAQGLDFITIGTPKNDDILNVIVKGERFGYTSESEVPANYETDAGCAVALKEQFKALLNAAETRPVVQIESAGAPEINGNFTVVDARQLRGRAGQVVLVLENDEGVRSEVWSYRHSGVIRKFSVVAP